MVRMVLEAIRSPRERIAQLRQRDVDVSQALKRGAWVEPELTQVPVTEHGSESRHRRA